MMKRVLFMVAALMAAPAMADLSALEAAHNNIQNQKAEAAIKAEAKQEADRRAAANRAAAAEKQRIAANKAANEKKAKAAARNEAYEDQNRELDLEIRRLELERLKARVSRENDVIDVELHSKRTVVDAMAEAVKTEAEASKIKAANPDTVNQTLIVK